MKRSFSIRKSRGEERKVVKGTSLMSLFSWLVKKGLHQKACRLMKSYLSSDKLQTLHPLAKPPAYAGSHKLLLAVYYIESVLTALWDS